ncbi:hypothetical protein [Methanobrevibacter filiformis]|uniref:Uncharacterized protein n=1 Tax=Methanobrevibacter filiformis TaxID=55758 RepID=A0A166F1J1_9EURY|nr:hypothetical protein [Methanobrevibacter filiformis]KZX17224.1 hypothetical protein MBFIL_02940 [Methanobrevibacter filiformis]
MFKWRLDKEKNCEKCVYYNNAHIPCELVVQNDYHFGIFNKDLNSLLNVFQDVIQYKIDNNEVGLESDDLTCVLSNICPLYENDVGNCLEKDD